MHSILDPPDNPLDRFEVNGDGNEVRFDNAAFRVGAAHGEVTYKVRWFALDNLKNEEHPVGEEIELRSPSWLFRKMPGAPGTTLTSVMQSLTSEHFSPTIPNGSYRLC